MIGIYKITNTKNEKVYIGQSTNIEERWKQHKYSLITSDKSWYPLVCQESDGIDDITAFLLKFPDTRLLEMTFLFLLLSFLKVG